MLAPRWLTGLILAIVSGMLSPAANAQAGGPADVAEKAVSDFCFPVVLSGGDPAAIAAELGIEPNYRVAPQVQDWASQNKGDYYHYPTTSGLVLIVVKAEKKQLACDVALFDVSYGVGARAFGQIDAIFQARRYRSIKGVPENHAKAYKGDRMLIILVGPQLGAGANDPAMHVTMKRRLYVF